MAQQAARRAEAPGEYWHYYINLLSLFGQAYPLQQIQAQAQAAVAQRQSAMAAFSERLDDLRSEFLRQGERNQRASHCPPPRLASPQDLQALVDVTQQAQRSGRSGALVAMFHYGPHRDLLCDLACAGIPFIAPVAKRAYFECNELAAMAPASFEQAMRLIEVEDPRVGLKLLRGLKQGRLGLIYVDGNMGPDGHRVEEGAVRVDFLGLPIRVKAGIARLARSLRLPIVPVLASHADGGRLHVGEVIAAPGGDSDADLIRVMQQLYDALGRQVQAAPAAWEFAFCLHRWREPEAPLACEGAGADSLLSPTRVALLERPDGLYWVDVRRQKAFRMPAFARGLYELLVEPRLPASFSVAGWLAERCGQRDVADQLLQELSGLGLLAAAAEPSPGLARV